MKFMFNWSTQNSVTKGVSIVYENMIMQFLKNSKINFDPAEAEELDVLYVNRP